MNEQRKRPFLDERRLLYGPWQAFERDVARLLLANGFEDVRIVGGTGDRGADILGVSSGELMGFSVQIHLVHSTTQGRHRRGDRRWAVLRCPASCCRNLAAARRVLHRRERPDMNDPA